MRSAASPRETVAIAAVILSPAEPLSRLRSQWVGIAVVTCGYALLIAILSRQFGYDRDVADMPVLLATACFVGAGLLFAAILPGRISASANLEAGGTAQLLAIVLVGGLIARLILFASEPILEDDYLRYLWDGAVSAHAMNPYDVAPRTVIDAGPAHPLSGLAADSGPVLRRINHPQLPTIYPPVAQAAFAFAHWISPWSLTAWRSVLMLCDAATLLALLGLLKETGRSLAAMGFHILAQSSRAQRGVQLCAYGACRYSARYAGAVACRQASPGMGGNGVGICCGSKTLARPPAAHHRTPADPTSLEACGNAGAVWRSGVALGRTHFLERLWRHIGFSRLC